MSKAILVDMARHNMAHAERGTVEQTRDVLRVPASHYTDPERFREEIRCVFRRMPLMLALTAELRAPGDFKTLEVAGVPVLLVRHADGDVRAFVNSCGHRGATLVNDSTGNRKRFSCPYHGWTYDSDGALVAVTRADDFGEFDRTCHGLVSLPVAERAGMVWVILDPRSGLTIDAFLAGYDAMLDNFGFADWHLYDSRTLPGPNWKVAYDGYMDLYHLPILHRETFGANMPNQALYYAWGPHQRVVSPDPELAKLNDEPESEWSLNRLMAGVWTIFPHVSIAGFGGGGRSVMISQLFPGETADSSRTVQNYLMQRLPETEEARADADAQFKLLEYVVSEEDYKTGFSQQRALASGLRPEVLFGRNEGGGQRFHGWVDRLLATPDDALPALFDKAGFEGLAAETGAS